MQRVFVAICIPAIILVGLGVAWFVQRAPAPTPPPAEIPIVWRDGPPDLLSRDPEEIFKKAFWRRPSSLDQIQQAERHEWRDAGGLKRWQWFLVVKASPDLIKYLRDDNAFGLVATSDALEVTEAPSWFQFELKEVTVLQSRHTGMRLMFSKSDSTLYATDSGRGFTNGAPEPSSTIQGAQPPGRIPSSPPSKL